jgi:hypothetical protein
MREAIHRIEPDAFVGTGKQAQISGLFGIWTNVEQLCTGDYTVMCSLFLLDECHGDNALIDRQAGSVYKYRPPGRKAGCSLNRVLASTCKTKWTNRLLSHLDCEGQLFAKQRCLLVATERNMRALAA